MNISQQDIFSFMQEFAFRAGRMALERQAGVRNVGKIVRGPIAKEDSAAAAAKTVVDEIIQELFLADLYKRFPHVRVNVEEDTPLVNLFSLRAPVTVHLDPVDGTLSYLRQKKIFSIGMAISDAKNRFTHSVIYAPALCRMYIASPKMCETLDGNGRKIREKNTATFSPIIYEKRILSEKGREAVEGLGFQIQEVPSCHVSIVRVALGRAAGFLYGLANPHDVLVPYAFARANNVVARDVRGRPFSFSRVHAHIENGRLRFDRLPSICYIAEHNSATNELISVLKNPSHLHPRYRRIILAR